MAERESTEQASPETTTTAPSAADLLRGTLEKIVFFEWRVRELSAELASAQSRAAESELARLRAEESARAAAAQAQAARLQAAGLEAERARLATLLARPAGHADAAGSRAALEAERDRSAQLSAQLDEARAQVARDRDERSRWLNEMIEQARAGDEAPAALAQFISELRGEVIALRDRQKKTDAQLAAAGLPVPPSADSQPPVAQPRRETSTVEAARALWDEGRLAVPPTASPAEGPEPRVAGSAARALAEQCLRGLSAADPARRTQAARHLAALPVAAAAPMLAKALGAEHDPKARAAIARALVACGGETAAEMVAALLMPAEPVLVRLAALEALALLGGDRGAAALEAAAQDPAPTLRRRAAALLRELGGHATALSRLTADTDASVRGAARGELRDLWPAPSPSSSSATAAPASAAPASAAPASAAPGPAAPAPAEAGVARARSTVSAGASTATGAAADRPELRADALHAIRTSMFGLTEAELAASVRLSLPDGVKLAAQLVEAGFLVRRGRRLIAGPAAEAAARVHGGPASGLDAVRGA